MTGNAPALRVARPSENLDSLLRFYVQGLGLTVLHRFEDHDGFDGVMLGHDGWPYHFEFTRSPGHPAGSAPTQEHLLVFYFPDRAEWERATQRMRQAGFEPVRSLNPYWDRKGLTFEDTDGYRVVLHCGAWPR